MSRIDTPMSTSGPFLHDEVVAPGQPWGRLIKRRERLTIIDLEGQQAVDFLCFDAADPRDRYSASNTIKVGRNPTINLGTVLYSDHGMALMTVVADSLGGHDTIYGCCSNANNRLRYNAPAGPNCYDNFRTALARFGLDESAIVSNINFFMRVPLHGSGRAEVAADVSLPGASVTLQAERDVLVVLSNCPQVHNPCNGFNPTAIRVTVRSAPVSGS
jgi:uncharacterized protein